MPRLDDYGQRRLVDELIDQMETMDMDEWESKYEMLDEEYQLEVDEAAQEFADGAVGSSSWRSDW